MKTINLDNYNRLIFVLKKFAGNIDIAYNSDVQARQIFIKNFIDAFSKIDLNNEETVDSANKYIEEIISYKIPILDIFNYFQLKTISLNELTYFFNNYYSFFDNRKLIRHKIYLSLLNNENFANIINSNNYVSANMTNMYIVPKLKYSYKTSDKYFISVFDATKKFYTIPINLNLLLNNKNIINDMRDFVERLNNSYNSKRFILFAPTNIKHEYSILKFINSLNIAEINSNSLVDTIKSMIPIKSIYEYLDNITDDMYRAYNEHISDYSNKDDPFNINIYLKNMSGPEEDTINYTNLNKYILDSYLYSIYHSTGDDSKLSEYINNINSYVQGVKELKLGIDEIINSVISNDNRFERGD